MPVIFLALGDLLLNLDWHAKVSCKFFFTLLASLSLCLGKSSVLTEVSDLELLVSEGDAFYENPIPCFLLRCDDMLHMFPGL